MMDKKAYFIGLVVGIVIMSLLWAYQSKQTKYKMNLKCVQGELYEEVRPNMFVKSHLECFEQKTLIP